MPAPGNNAATYYHFPIDTPSRPSPPLRLPEESTRSPAPGPATPAPSSSAVQKDPSAHSPDGRHYCYRRFQPSSPPAPSTYLPPPADSHCCPAAPALPASPHG